MITHKKITEMLKNWGVENEKITDIYYEGKNNKNENAFYVGESFIIKATTNLPALKNHIAISNALEKAGLMAATPVATTNGNEYVLDGELYFSLTKRLDGEQIKSGEMYEGDYKSKARYLGEIIGQLHIILKKHDDIICNDSNMLETVSGWALPNTKKAMELPESFYTDYLDTFGKLYAKLPKQIIHRDPNPGNIIMVDGKLSGFIDFELSERNVRLFDPCYAATAILSESFAQGDADKLSKWIDIYKNIIYGYDGVCKLSNEEKQALPYVVFSIQMICVAYFNGIDKYQELANTNKKMLKWLSTNKDKLLIE